MNETPAPGPLTGIRVLDVTEYMAGPYCSAILGDMGAEVIKVERPGIGDRVRTWQDCKPRNPQFRYINRNKQSLTLDYKTPEGKEIFLRLADQADIFVENFRPSVLEKVGLTYDVLSRRNPRLIYCSLSGFGSDGPLRNKAGFDLVAQAMGGLMHVTGESDGPPLFVGQPVVDLGTGMWGAIGVLAALHQRAATGKGQRVEGSLLETAVALTSWSGALYLMSGVLPERLGARHRQLTPYQRFNTQDGYMVMTCGSQANWERFCAVMKRDDWASDPRYANMELRAKNRSALEKDLEEVFTQRPTEHWMKVFDDTGIPCGPIHDYEQLFEHPQVKHREMVVYVDDPEFGRAPNLRMPVRLSDADVSVRTAAPALGEHTEQILSGLGYSPEQIRTLREKRVL